MLWERVLIGKEGTEYNDVKGVLIFSFLVTMDIDFKCWVVLVLPEKRE